MANTKTDAGTEPGSGATPYGVTKTVTARRDPDGSTTRDADEKKRSQMDALGLGKGDLVSRYVILEEIGRGGMGVVLKAYDPDLDRRLAIKLLRVEKEVAMQARLRREGQAIARLSHPNVVAAYDVGVFEGRIFVAMEYVGGVDLRRWQEESDPSLDEILDVFVQAGRGLAAAHEAGIIHRDFKPHNVLVGSDGRVRVADFGLARAVEEESEADSLAGTEYASSSEELQSQLTRTGWVVGTPAYMAPEQVRNAAPDERTDQFSFCAAFYQAVVGKLPFEAGTFEVSEPESPATMAPISREVAMPGWLERLLARGLSIDPAGRFGSMSELLGEIEQHSGQARRRWWLPAAVVIAVASLLAVYLLRSTDRDPCPRDDAALAGIWDQHVKDRVEAGFLATERRNAASAFERVEAALDRYSSDWLVMRREACEATRVQGVQSDEMLDLRIYCLDRRVGEMAALITQLGEPSPDAVERAATAASGLTPLAVCADRDALAATIPPPEDPELREVVEAMFARLDEAAALSTVGRHADARKIADKVAAKALALDYWPIRARALHSLGVLHSKNHDQKAAEATLRRAIDAGGRAGNIRGLADTLLAMVWVVGYQGRHEEALAFATVAEATAISAGNDKGLRGRLASVTGDIYGLMGNYAESRKSYESAIELVEAGLGPDHFHLANVLGGYGRLLTDLGEGERAEKLQRRALAIYEAIVGPTGRPTMTRLQELANALLVQRKFDEALEVYRRQLTLAEEFHGEDGQMIGAVLHNIGVVYLETRALEEAEDYFRRGLALQEDHTAADDPHLGYSLGGVGGALVAQKRFAEARPYYQRALHLRSKRFAPDSVLIAESLVGLGECDLGLSRPASAVELLERAVTVLERSTGNAEQLALARFALARALVAARGDTRRALALAESARQTFATETRFHDLREVEEWLADQR